MPPQFNFDLEMPVVRVNPFAPSPRNKDPDELPAVTDIANGLYPVTEKHVGYLRWVIGELMEHGKTRATIIRPHSVRGTNYGIGFLGALLHAAEERQNERNPETSGVH